ncbi:hypothetical protein F4694_000636 [Bacillus niacini]|uniref:Uncharacterized protein n=1 Tax=Neobacillus niacini TaxID=86668 RepID=A0A852T7Z7_9BACI|nr:hypothetical protein [Neobacillus niacini]
MVLLIVIFGQVLGLYQKHSNQLQAVDSSHVDDKNLVQSFNSLFFREWQWRYLIVLSE